jgi:hypothetical protein
LLKQILRREARTSNLVWTIGLPVSATITTASVRGSLNEEGGLESALATTEHQGRLVQIVESVHDSYLLAIFNGEDKN